jgi:hypothetical protein
MPLYRYKTAWKSQLLIDEQYNERTATNCEQAVILKEDMEAAAAHQ